MPIWLIVVAAAVFIILLAGIMRDSNRFIVVEHTLTSDKIKKEINFVVLSDLHNKSYGEDNGKLLEAIGKIRPEAILVAGDMLTASPERDFSVAVGLMQKLAEKYPVYYGMGNHEYRLRIYPDTYGDMYERYMTALARAGVKPLVNAHSFLEQYNIDICGLEIRKEYYKRFRKQPMEKEYLKKLLGWPKKDAFQILLAHNPVYFQQYAGWGADLVLSGHVHGGVVRLPFFGGVISPGFRLFPKYDGGVFHERGSTMVLSRGLGSHTIPVRLNNPGELIALHLCPAEAAPETE